MENHESYTRLLGLALRGGNLVAGSDATQGAVYAGTARLLLVSADASVRTCKDAALWAERGNCPLIALPCDKATLGEALGRGAAAVAALTDAGLAAAVGERLARFDSERYGAIAERLRVKSKRAAERREARARARPDNAAARPEKDRKSAAANPDRDRKLGAARPHKDAKPGVKAVPRKSAATNARKPAAARLDKDRKPGAARFNKAIPRKPDGARTPMESGTGGGDSATRRTERAAPRKFGAARKAAAPQKRDVKTRKK